jgi:hypothetical protein
MSTDKKSLDIKSFIAKGSGVLKKLRRYSFVLFVVFVAALYGFVVLRISSLSNTQPSSESVAGQVQAAEVPHIDQQAVQQLNSLRNNSVSVQALFNQTRNNPF